MLRLPNCDIDNLACDISSELYGEYQQKAYGLKFCDISCRVGDLDERILLKYLYDSGIPIEQLLPKTEEEKKLIEAGTISVNRERLQPAHQFVNKTVINNITNYNASFVFTQNDEVDVWDIVHNLGYFPNVTVVNTSNERIEAVVEYIDENHIIISIGTPLRGRAFLS